MYSYSYSVFTLQRKQHECLHALRDNSNKHPLLERTACMVTAHTVSACTSEYMCAIRGITVAAVLSAACHTAHLPSCNTNVVHNRPMVHCEAVHIEFCVHPAAAAVLF
jgi:hypothetical protein